MVKLAFSRRRAVAGILVVPTPHRDGNLIPSVRYAFSIPRLATA